VVKKDPLITYESVISGQAGSENVSGSTVSFERKLMSTKTSIKRIAAVAAVALTLGGFSGVSAHATGTGQWNVSIVNGPTTGTVGTDVSAIVNVNQVYFDATGSYPGLNISGAWINSEPATSALATTNLAWSTDTGTAYTNANVDNTYVGNLNAYADYTAYTKAFEVKSNVVGTRSSQYMKLTFRPDVAGTYTIRVFAAPTVTTTALYADWTVTVAAKPSISASASTIYASSDYTTPSTSANTDEAGTLIANKKVISTPAAVFNITEANGSTDYRLITADALAVTATVAGPGLVSFNTDRTTAGRAVTNSAAFGSTYNTLNQQLYIFSDGTPGVSTVTFTTTDKAGTTTTLGTQVITFFGAPAAYAPTVVNSVITTDAVVPASSSTIGNSGYHAIKVKVTDSAGNPVSGADVYANSDNKSVLNLDYAKATSGATGYAYFNLQGSAAGTANVSFTSRTSAGDTTTTLITGSSVQIRVGSSTPSKATIAFDSSTYNPGALATLSVTVVDSKGLPVADGVYTVFTDATTTSLAFLQGSTPGTAGSIACVSLATGIAAACAAGTTVAVKPTISAGQVWVKGSTGTATYTVNMPMAAGDVTLKGTADLGLNVAIAGTTLSATATVGSDPATQAAIDAAQEATDAANAAYDAANNAMDSADAATAAAQDASDNASAALAAVTSLSATVAKLVQSVASIAAALAKIQKKLKA